MALAVSTLSTSGLSRRQTVSVSSRVKADYRAATSQQCILIARMANSRKRGKPEVAEAAGLEMQGHRREGGLLGQDGVKRARERVGGRGLEGRGGGASSLQPTLGACCGVWRGGWRGGSRSSPESVLRSAELFAGVEGLCPSKPVLSRLERAYRGVPSASLEMSGGL